MKAYGADEAAKRMVHVSFDDNVHAYADMYRPQIDRGGQPPCPVWTSSPSRDGRMPRLAQIYSGPVTLVLGSKYLNSSISARGITPSVERDAFCARDGTGDSLLVIFFRELFKAYISA
jgi:hypothetical protein